MRDTLAFILAGGIGSRLNILVKKRAKPAVPFGGTYRIIDFALSNAMNSGLLKVAVLTQYKPLSLMSHIGTGHAWDFIGRTRCVKILPPRTGEKDSDWYKGTADAVRQNLDFITNRASKEVLILSGDHVYYMDYRAMVESHRRSGAKVTVAMMPVPWEETSQFGIGIVDSSGRVVDWEEKPEKARSNLASLGIYVFNTDYLVQALTSTKEEDFGYNILPRAMKDGELYAYTFTGYWRDVGTVKAFWDANMDMVRPNSGLDPEGWGITTNWEEEERLGDRPPTMLASEAQVENSVISPGCTIKGIVRDSILSPGVVVESGAVVEKSVIMHDTRIGQGAILKRVVSDKEVYFGKESSVGDGDIHVANHLYPRHLSSGITLVGKGAYIPDGAIVGTNCIVFPGIQEAEWDKYGKRLNDGETLKDSE